ncbi:MAG: zinc ribbon domain-containing protein [Desulfovibrionaceae bacterium]|nr:zinc ribbon domain-containing protein [Desulfovibrionaceae bacterium]
MPIYEYECPSCGRIFEEWVKVSEAHGEEACPACGTPSPRVISHTSFVLKGGGWYVTEYGYRKGVNEDGEKKNDPDKAKEESKEKTAESPSQDKSQKEPNGQAKTEKQGSEKESGKQAEKGDSKEKSGSSQEKPSTKAKDTAAPQSGGGSAKNSS